MTVKIPYPLMQLPVDDMPHRFDDPRLRGQLTTLRTHLYPSKPGPNLGSDADSQTDISGSQENLTVDKPEDTCSDVFPVPAAQRRPVKLQLNEMASVFASTNSFESSNPKSGDRSYLDDPRFKRRRILNTGSNTAVNTNLSTESQNTKSTNIVT